MSAVEADVRNSWRPLFRGRLDPAGTGSELVGSIGWSPFVKVFSALWLSCGCGLVVALAGLGSVLCLVPLGFVLLFAGLVAVGIKACRREDAYLRSWLVERLQTAESAIPGYHPWRQG